MEKLTSPPPDGWIPAIHVAAENLPAAAVARLEPAIPSRRQILGWQRLTVRDNGMGMSNHVRERIFEPFYTTKDVGMGTGLGLATVWHLVTEVSGRIEVESSPGQGSSFHVFLPMCASKASVEPTVSLQERPAPGSGRIFLAEDDEMVATAVTSSLRRTGYSLIHEANGATAWQHLQTHFESYDLVMLDVNMPGLDGIALAKRLRGSGQFRGRIMVVSGRLGSDDLQEISAAKVDCVLNKPFRINELLDSVKNCLSPAAK